MAIITTLFILFTSVSIIIAKETISPATVGLCLSYALSVFLK
jgi:hypothetical protein